MQWERAALHGWARDELEAWDQQERAKQREQQQRKSGKGNGDDGNEFEGGWRVQGASVALSQRLRLKGPKAPPRFTLRLRIKIERWVGICASAKGASGNAHVGVLASDAAPASTSEQAKAATVVTNTAPAAVVEEADEEWWLRSGVGQGTSWALASSADAERADHALWPAVTVAARVSRFVHDSNCRSSSSNLERSSSSNHGVIDSHVAVAGHAFAALKLASLPTGWPVHVSARWALSDNRRDLVRFLFCFFQATTLSIS